MLCTLIKIFYRSVVTAKDCHTAADVWNQSVQNNVLPKLLK